MTQVKEFFLMPTHIDVAQHHHEHCGWLEAAARRAARTAEAPDVVVDAVRRAEMDPEHAALDDLME